MHYTQPRSLDICIILASAWRVSRGTTTFIPQGKRVARGPLLDISSIVDLTSKVRSRRLDEGQSRRPAGFSMY